MTLDSSVMNVSMATVAADLGTTITGIQTAITLYTLVMATLMVTGGKIGMIIGRRRAFALGAVIYGMGSFVTGLAPNLAVLIIGWSFLEGMGAALIMPATVALVASNFATKDRPKAYGLVASAGAIAVACGPLIGGAATTYGSWRWVFFGEVIVVAVILVMSRRMADTEVEPGHSLDLVGTLLSVVGLGLAVFGVLRSSEWGWVKPKSTETAQLLEISLTFWFLLVGLFVVWLFFRWEHRVVARGGDPLVRPDILRNAQLDGGLLMFAFQFLLQAGVFFVVPLFLSVMLGLSAMETGVRIMPLSVALLVAAAGIPKLWPDVSPRRVVRIGMLGMLAGILTLMSGIQLNASAAVVSVPLVFVGLGIGCLASQLGSVTVSAVPTRESGEVGGLQNTATNLGASLGTALAGSVMITVLTSSIIAGIQANPQVPDSVKTQASGQLAAGVPFMSDADLESAMTKAGATPAATSLALEINATARVDGLDAALAVLAVIAVASLFFTGRIPDRQPTGDEDADPEVGAEPLPGEDSLAG
jgi:EmrB/QacA subfamily drug resistance transporter